MLVVKFCRDYSSSSSSDLAVTVGDSYTVCLLCVCALEATRYCNDDYLLIYSLFNGSVTPRLRRRLCGTNRQYSVGQLGGFRLKFITDNSFVNRGFVANFLISRKCHISLAESQ